MGYEARRLRDTAQRWLSLDGANRQDAWRGKLNNLPEAIAWRGLVMLCNGVHMTVHPPLPHARCKPGAVAGTFSMGIALGPVVGAVIAIGSSFLHGLFSPNDFQQTLMVSVMFCVFGGILFGFVSSVGAALALLIVDWRLRRSRFVQGAIAGAGALVPAIGLFVYIGQYATGGFQAAPLLLAVVFTCAFALVVFRAKKHRATPN